MKLRVVGPSLYSSGGTVFELGVATIFPDTHTLITKGTTHYTHRQEYCDLLEEERCAAKAAPLSADEREKIWLSGVDLIVQPDVVLIRPDPDQIDLVLVADEQLQETVSKHRIRFQLASNAKVRGALTKRGELWRITSDALTTDEMVARVQNARMKLGGRAIYYYSPPIGTRFLTLKELRNLADRDAAELYQHLVEIQTYCQRHSKRGGLEVDFFLAGASLRAAFREARFPETDEVALRAEHRRLCKLFEEDVLPHLRSDDVCVPDWLQKMYGALYPLQEDAADAEECLGLAAEFRRHVQWLPGGRMKQGHLDYDSIYDSRNGLDPAEIQRQENLRSRAIILNFVRDYGDLEHINVGWINESLSRARRPERGRRAVYVVEMKRASEEREQIRFLRMQKWDMTYRLDQFKSPEAAMFETEEYTEYTQDRYLGCRRLGMNLFGPVRIGKISELYQGKQQHLRETPIWTPYFERAYVHGIASDKILEDRWTRPGYADRFAQLLGQAAAPNIIVGRGDGATEGIPDERLVVFFDDGDEIAIERDGMVEELIVTHHTGSFWHFDQPLCRLAPAYAAPVNRRVEDLPDPAAFARIYLDSLIDRFIGIQREYIEDRRSFEQLFHLRHIRKEGNFVHRWQRVLERLEETDAIELKDAIAACMNLTRLCRGLV